MCVSRTLSSVLPPLNTYIHLSKLRRHETALSIIHLQPSKMYELILFTIVFLCLFVYFIVYPIAVYFLDPKGLCKYPNLNLISSITDLGFNYESNKGFRSKTLLEAHKMSRLLV